MANYDFSKFKKRAGEVEEWFKNEASLIRTGRASPVLIENTKVDYYGGKSLLKTISAISVEDARTLLIKPWDIEAVMPIEQAINASDLGVQAVPEKNIIRVIFPELTEERRVSLSKILREKLEQAKTSLRRERDEIWRDIQDKERKKEISEDDKYRFKDDLQEFADETVKKMEEMNNKKEEEIAN